MHKQHLVVLGIVFALANGALAEEKAAPRTITVSGKATVNVAPDEAEIVLGVQTYAEDLVGSKKVNDDRTNKVIEAAAGLSIAARDVQTSQISIEPDYEDVSWRRQYSKINGYITTRTISVHLRDLSKFDSVLTGLLNAGANQVHGVELRRSDLRKYRDQARGLALKAAREKAELMAQTYGQKVGAALTIGEVTESDWRFSGGLQQMQVNASASNGGSGSGDEAFAAGEIPIQASVTVAFELVEGK